MNKKIRKIIEDNDWGIYETVQDKNVCFEFSWYSPAGEDFSFAIWVPKKHNSEDVISKVREYANDFDPDEHFTMLLESNLSGVPGIRELINDADAIAEKLKALADALFEGGR